MNYHAFINGIEIVSMPMNLYYKPFVPVVGQTNPIYSRALEMVYRLNVGGGAIQAQEDTGMFRKWSEDRDYLLSGRFGPHDPSLKPKYTKIPNYTAPDAVYQSAISMGPDSNKTRKSNLTWRLPVDTGFNFLVRLHFCEIESEIHASGRREFCIYIDYQLAEEKADVLLWTHDNDTPYYKDYVVMIKNKGNDTRLLSIDLHPRLDAQLIDAILNGVEVFKLSDSDNNLAGANIAAPLLDQQQLAGAANESKSKKTTIFIAIGSVLGLLVVLTLVCCMVLCKLKKTKHYGSYHPLAKRWWWSRPDPCKREFSRRARRLIGNEESHKPFPSDNLNQVQELPLFNFEMLVSATNDFHLSNKLGQGGFGPVYKGKLSDGQEIAVKRLSRTSAQGLKEFMNEVVIISKLQHRNLVRLLGCCVEGEERMLLYEYMPNKSLDAFLFDPHKERLLDWKKRFNIIEGIGRGLLYLHRDSRLRIIHRDLKTSNILLDKELNPKISDFGMARIFGSNEDQANTNRVVGTYGYMSPEYAMEGRFSEKSDVFSFGVLLLEIVNGRKNTSFYNDEQSQSLLGLAWKLWNADNAIALINPMIYEPCFEIEILRCIQVGLLCVQEFAQDRPTVSVVISMLKSEIGNLPPPTKPAFTEKLIALDTDPSKCFQTKCSVNDITVTMVQGR
nr:G-type lectin S-receptor-like serine/threonine-protein kinase At1g11330 [Quercus suber]